MFLLFLLSFLFLSRSSLNKGIRLWSQVKRVRAVPRPWLMTIWQAPVNAANLSPSRAVPLGRQHLSRPRWRVAQPAGYPVSVTFSTTRCSSVKSGWQQINCKLGRNKNDGKKVCELVLVCVLSSKTDHQWPLQARPPLTGLSVCICEG